MRAQSMEVRLPEMGREKPQKPCCQQCRHFHNSPEYLEAVFKGLTALSSAYGSVRKEDGICERRDIYLSADQCCRDFDLL